MLSGQPCAMPQGLEVHLAKATSNRVVIAAGLLEGAVGEEGPRGEATKAAEFDQEVPLQWVKTFVDIGGPTCGILWCGFPAAWPLPLQGLKTFPGGLKFALCSPEALK